MGGAGVHRIDQPNHHMHYLLRGPAEPPCDMSTEEVCSFGKRGSVTSFFSCEEFLEAWCEVKPKRQLRVTRGGGKGEFVSRS